MSPNILAIDYGLKRIGLAYAVSKIITPLPMLKNDAKLIENLAKIIKAYSIEKIYVGISEGRLATKSFDFVIGLRNMLKLPVETVEEAVSTIEAAEILIKNRHPKKQHRHLVDSVSAAVILNRVIN